MCVFFFIIQRLEFCQKSDKFAGNLEEEKKIETLRATLACFFHYAIKML